MEIKNFCVSGPVSPRLPIYKLLQVRTICSRPNELRAQRWLVRSLIQTEFALPRREAVRCLRIVFSVDLAPARLLHDQTLLELRRSTLDGRTHYPKVNEAVLRDKRERGLLKFRPFLSQVEFNKLIYLMRNLAPEILNHRIQQQLRALNGTRNSQTEQEVIRRNLDHALNGYPDSRPLFSEQQPF
jgi:hypothetical protein